MGPRSHKQASLRSLQRWGIAIRQRLTPCATQAPWPTSCNTHIISITSKWITNISFARAIYVVNHKQTNHLPIRQTANTDPKKTFLTEFFRNSSGLHGPWKSCWKSMIWASLGGAEGKSGQLSPCKVQMKRMLYCYKAWGMNKRPSSAAPPLLWPELAVCRPATNKQPKPSFHSTIKGKKRKGRPLNVLSWQS